MIAAERFIDAAAERGFGLYAGVPCSYLTPFINYVLRSDRLRYIGAANEGDAVAIAAGAELGGLRSIAMLQNSGLGNAVSPLTSLTHTFRLPVLLIVTWRGEPGGAADEPQHELMGRITPALLERMEIPWCEFPSEDAEIGPTLDRALSQMQTERRPYALIMRKGSVAAGDAAPTPRSEKYRKPRVLSGSRAVSTRSVVLQAIQAASADDDIIIATTGYTGRELYATGDRPNQFYMVGSMGCAVSIGLGLAIARTERRIIVIDGDGAVLMRFGALATVGAEQPVNLVHVVIDNGMHESTGGQATVSPLIDLPGVAAACGYAEVVSNGDPDELRDALSSREAGLRFYHVPVRPGVTDRLPRPAILPADVAARLRRHLGPRH
jgi:phosphonopyruvate decarboxylase